MRMPQTEINARAARIERIEVTLRRAGGILVAVVVAMGLLMLARMALATAAGLPQVAEAAARGGW